MRLSALITALFLTVPVWAQDCDNDYAGIQQTAGYDYQIDWEAELARNATDFVNAASNWLHFSSEGDELSTRLVNWIRLRDGAVYIPACNDIGQCATIRIQSVAVEFFGGIDYPFAHLGFSISAEFNGQTFSRFYQADSRVYWSYLSQSAAADKRCRDNNGDLRDDPPPAPPPENNNDDDGEEFNEDEEENYIEEEEFPEVEDDWDWAEDEEDEPCEACEFWFDSDEDGDVDDGPYGPTDEEWIEEL